MERKWPRRWSHTPRPGPQKGTGTVDTKRIPVSGDPFYAAACVEHDDTVQAHYASLERPHACTDGVVYIGYLVEQDGEEVEVIEAVPCRRCAEEAR